jgi:hypothetical protein
MLEDPTYSQVVRWGDEMDSFVVLEVSCRRPVPMLRADLTRSLE